MNDQNILFTPDEKYFYAAINLIQSAQKELFLCNFQMQIPTGKKKQKLIALYNALERKAAENIKVKILLHGLSGKSRVSQTNICTANILKKKSIQIRTLPIWRTIHAKIIIADEKKMLTGSHNWTCRSLNSNLESSFLVKDSPVIFEVKNFLLSTWSNAIPF